MLTFTQTSHFFDVDVRRSLLQKFFVRKCTELPRSSDFTFDEDGFYKTLKNRVKPVLKSLGGTGPTNTMLSLQGKSYHYEIMET